VILGSELM